MDFDLVFYDNLFKKYLGNNYIQIDYKNQTFLKYKDKVTSTLHIFRHLIEHSDVNLLIALSQLPQINSILSKTHDKHPDNNILNNFIRLIETLDVNYEKSMIIINPYDYLTTILTTLRSIVRNSSYHYNLLSDNYINALVLFIKSHLTYQYETDLTKLSSMLKSYIDTVDVNTLVPILQQEQLESLNVNFREQIDLNVNKLSPDVKAFVKSLIRKLSNVFEVIDYIMNNPNDVIKSCDIFVKNNDDVFN